MFILLASANNFAALLARLIPVEFTPPAFYLFMYYWIRLFGTDDVVMKLPCLVFGLLLIPVVYLLGKEVGGRFVGVISAAITTLSPLAAFYSLECRAYSPITFFCCVAALFYCRTIGKNKSAKYPIALSLCLLIALYLHYTAFLFVAALVITTVILWKKKQANLSLVHWSYVFLVPVLGFIPWMSVLIRHLQANSHPIERPLWYQWVGVFFGNILAASPVLSETMLQILYGTAFFLLALWALFKFCRQRNFLNAVGIKDPNKLMAIIICLFLPAALEGYVTPQTSRYMFPFAPFEWILFAACAVACGTIISNCNLGAQ